MKRLRNGLYITVDGGEGLGKSTVVRMLGERLECTITRQPGGTRIGSDIRQITHNPANTDLDPVTEALLMAADRAHCVEKVVIPGLERSHVISDRSHFSSYVYQGIVRGLGIERVEAINQLAIPEFMAPDVAFILDAPWDVIAKRRRVEGREDDRFEREGEEFHMRILQGFRDLAPLIGAVVINADQTPDKVASDMLEVINQKIAEV